MNKKLKSKFEMSRRVFTRFILNEPIKEILENSHIYSLSLKKSISAKIKKV
jgi:hypothetical protein